ncbi:MAG: single-stranded DNA-binding protein [Bacteroidales bacterium]|nr:single-stranded DNA-binding protein [Bacteroidales bacterium]
MSGVNKVILIGNLGKDPEVKTFENGLKKASFPLATSENYKDKEGRTIEQVEWHNIVCWRSLAEIAERYLTKGKQIYLEGRIKTRTWEENGSKRYITEIEANTFTMLGSKPDNPVATKIQNGGEQERAQAAVNAVLAAQPSENDDSSEGLPF